MLDIYVINLIYFVISTINATLGWLSDPIQTFNTHGNVTLVPITTNY